MSKYSKAAQEKIGKVMEEYKKGELESGSGPNNQRQVTDRKQAVAIGISEARKEGKKVPDERKN